MVDEQLIARGIHAPQVLAAMRTVPRHLFVEESFQQGAYEDHPIPIGAGQTISQPYMVALMTELLELTKESVVLEIGTGSGYQTAILAELANQVYTIERLAKLAEKVKTLFERLHYPNIHLRVGDGTLGWIEYAPYDRIIVTAGAPSVPEQLFGQLAENGKLVIPVGNRFSQVLQVVTKRNNQITTKTSCHCVFVKLIGKQGWEN
jgi:protein-L-isoaspartate(D-aspartate) O-methyltransferase